MPRGEQVDLLAHYQAKAADKPAQGSLPGGKQVQMVEFKNRAQLTDMLDKRGR